MLAIQITLGLLITVIVISIAALVYNKLQKEGFYSSTYKSINMCGSIADNMPPGGRLYPTIVDQNRCKGVKSLAKYGNPWGDRGHDVYLCDDGTPL